MPSIHEAHFSAFLKLAKPNLSWDGAEPRAWCRSFVSQEVLSQIPALKMARRDLRAFCQKQEISAEVAAIACMAWGGMNRRHGAPWWSERKRWLPIVQNMRAGLLTRKDAYSSFKDAKIEGLGPAYYTKLIYFMRPEPDGYIMDQWTGKSVSLLLKEPFISISRDGWVLRSNNGTVYERYCEAVEVIREKLCLETKAPETTPDEIEAMLFSKGGRQPWAWRRYVKDNWQAA